MNFEEIIPRKIVCNVYKKTALFCVCCLITKGPYIYLHKCTHSDYLDRFKMPQGNVTRNQIVCYDCHHMLKKIKQFKIQIQKSCDFLFRKSCSVNEIGLDFGFSDLLSLSGKKKRITMSQIENHSIPERKEKVKNLYNSTLDLLNTKSTLITVAVPIPALPLSNTTPMQVSPSSKTPKKVLPSSNITPMQVLPSSNITPIEVLPSSNTPNPSNSKEKYSAAGVLTPMSQEPLNVKPLHEEEPNKNLPYIEVVSHTGHNLTDKEKNKKVKSKTIIHNSILFNKSQTDNKKNVSDDSNNFQDNDNMESDIYILNNDNPSSDPLSDKCLESEPNEVDYLEFKSNEVDANLELELNETFNDKCITDMLLTEIKKENVDIEFNDIVGNDVEIESSIVETTMQVKYENDVESESNEVLKDGNVESEVIINDDDGVDVEITGFYGTAIMSNVKMEPEVVVEVNEEVLPQNDCDDGLRSKDISAPTIKGIKLSRDEIFIERQEKLKSEEFLRHPYRCYHCIVCFEYKENLQDHRKRKHEMKSGYVKCDICSQMVLSKDLKFKHAKRHYYRFQCSICRQVFVFYDDAQRHYRIAHVHNGDSKRKLSTGVTSHPITQDTDKKCTCMKKKKDSHD